MSRNVNDIVRKFPLARRKKIEARAQKLMTEEMTRQELRGALKRAEKCGSASNSAR